MVFLFVTFTYAGISSVLSNVRGERGRNGSSSKMDEDCSETVG